MKTMKDMSMRELGELMSRLTEDEILFAVELNDIKYYGIFLCWDIENQKNMMDMEDEKANMECVGD